MSFPLLSDKNLILTGYIEPNKPRIARQVAEKMGMRFVDVEEQIEARLGESTESIRDTYGGRHLKAVEDEMMDEISLYRKAVLRIPGSTLTNGDHLERLQETGIVCCLVARLDAILRGMHISMGARYHNPSERAMAMGELAREWAIRKADNIYEIDATYKDEEILIDEICDFWYQAAARRG